MQSYKSAVTRHINALHATPGEPLWQRNFYDTIIRDARHLDAVRRYIAENPGRASRAPRT
jgi:hypothetical protein